MPRPALFDMDRTLVRRETASLYIRYQRDVGEATFKDSLRVGYWVLQYTLGIIDAKKVAERALAQFRGMPESHLESRCEDWFRRYVEVHVSDRARDVVAAHLASGDTCAIVTGASPYAARPLAKALAIPHVVASELEIDSDGRFTGRPSYPLCYAEGKLERATKLAQRLGFELRDSVFYSDSITDLPLLEAVGEAVCVNPDFRLRRVARKRGWRIEVW